MELWIWLGIIVILSIIEALTVELVSIWFIFSGIVSLVLQLLGVDFNICLKVFIILGIILMLTTRKYLVKLLKVDNTKTNIDRIIGMKCLVTEDITSSLGAVKVDGKIWTAISNDTLKKGDYAKVLEICSTKLKVEKWSDK